MKILTAKVKAIFKSAPRCHDWEHTDRVWRNARLIAVGESKNGPVDMTVLEAAAILHDVARPAELKTNGKECHAENGAEMAKELLAECGFTDQDMVANIVECVKRHRYRGKSAPPETIEQKIIFDADKLDSIGAIGVGRAIHFSGRIGSTLHNTEEEAMASDPYGEGDSAFREYLVKLRHIPEKMLTATGRSLATQRAEYMHKFFAQLNSEVYGDL